MSFTKQQIEAYERQKVWMNQPKACPICGTTYPTRHDVPVCWCGFEGCIPCWAEHTKRWGGKHKIGKAPPKGLC